jgi:uncharacterized protein involved in outer membrane biogenesis
MGLRENLSTLARWQKWALGFALALVLYAISGFLVLPPIVRAQSEQALREATGREARIGEVRINPFLLSLTVRDFSLADGDGSPFVEFAELHADFEASSIFRRALTFRETRLVAPFVHLKILPDGSLNLAELITGEEQVEEPAAGDSAPLAVLIGLAAIERGRLVFTDQSHATIFEHEITPLDVELRNFGTRPDDRSPYSFTATTGAGETLAWEGNLTVVPLLSAGRFELTGVQPRTGWRYVQDNVLFEVTEGSVDVKGRYELDAREGLRGRLDDGEIRIRNFAIVDRESGEPALDVPELDVDGITISYPEQDIHVDSIVSKRARIRLARLADGSFRIEQLSQMGSASEPDADEVPVTPLTAEADDPTTVVTGDTAPPWRYAIDRIEFTGNRVEFHDTSTPTPVEIVLDPLDLRVSDLTSDPTAAIQLALLIAAESGGRIELEGPVVLEPPGLEIQIKGSDLDLRPFEPYWASMLAVDLTSGRLGFDGRLGIRGDEAQAPRLEFTGDFRVDDLRTLDRAQSADLLGWSALELTGVDLALEPTSFRLAKLRLTRPTIHLVLAPDGTSNLSTLIVESTDDAGAADTAGTADAETSSDAAADPIPIEIALLEISDGAIELQDLGVTPNFSARVSAFGGRIEGLSSDTDARARVALTGLLDGATPLAIDGVLSPLARDPYVDLRIAFENFELTPFTAYSGRYVGRKIARGKLFVELEYVLEANMLVGENKVFLDQFTLGERVDSEDALDLPVGLAIALLKNRAGEIRIDLPVRGDVDDPEFGVGRIIGMALRNLIAKVALSPFAIVGGLAGADGDAMSQVQFAPGSADLDAVQIAKLDALAQALAERPALSLEVTGEANSQLDRPALQTASLESQLRLMRFREARSAWFGEKPASVDEVVVEPADRRRLLESLYTQSATLDDEPLPAAGEDPTIREAELSRRLREQVVIEPAALRDLAQRRAVAIREHLVSVGDVPAVRIFVLDVALDAGALDQPPRASLALAAD